MLDDTAKADRQLQLAAWGAAQPPGRKMSSKWSRQLSGTVRADGNATRALVTSEAVETRAALAPIAEDARVGSVAAVAALDLLMGKDVGRRPGQTAKERLM